MINVTLKYNPYLLSVIDREKESTYISIDGQQPKSNSSLNDLKGKRLQEWVDRLPHYLLEEFKDHNITIQFTGTNEDYDDLVSAFEAYNDTIHVNFKEPVLKKGTAIVDSEIHKIFDKIQSSKRVPELHDPKIIDAFKTASNMEFEINVIATMSAGKSTLINALLGRELLPARNEATTATIVRIVSSDDDMYSAVAYDKDGNVIKRIDDIRLSDMESLNEDKNITAIDIYGKISFIPSAGMRLVLVDTPGPNNARDEEHKAMTFRMLEESSKSLVLFVMNATQEGTDDEKALLDYVCKKMKEHGKQSRDRYIFAINKLDDFKVSQEGTDYITRMLTKTKKRLYSEYGIDNPNLFPVSALTALEIRTEDDECDKKDSFKRKSDKYGDLVHFETYTDFSHLPLYTQQNIERLKNNSSNTDDDILEIHSGIISIEQAIKLYIDKYAKTTKVSDLVQSFNSTLTERSAFALIENDIIENKEKKAELDEAISKLSSLIQSAEKAEERKSIIDGIDIKSNIEKEIDDYFKNVNTKISKLIDSQSPKISKIEAITMCENLKKDCSTIIAKIKVEVDKLLDDAYKKSAGEVVNEYIEYLKNLNMIVDSSAFKLNTLSLVSSSLADLSSVINRNTTSIDNGHNVIRTRIIHVPSARTWYKPWTWFNKGAHDEPENYPEWKHMYVDYVDMSKVASEYLLPLRADILKNKESALKFADKESQRLKETLNNKINEINNLLLKKMSELNNIQTKAELTAKEIHEKEENLKWLESIRKEVNELIEF